MKRKEHLIPLEKSKRVIRLDRREPTVRNKSFGVVLLGILSLACLVYCLSIFFFMGYGSRFFVIWGVLAVFLGMLAWLLSYPEKVKRIPRFWRRIFGMLSLIGLIVFLAVEGMILSGFSSQPAQGADYVIILGAQWKTSGPSYVLKKRLDVAADYLKENPQTMAIVSGGQGSNEPVSEAVGMKGYLIDLGIPEERILMEDASTNTNENLINSSALLNKEKDRVVLVTNNFHIFRACGIARHQGYARVEGLAAGSYPGMLPNNLLREFFGVIKDTLAGNM